MVYTVKSTDDFEKEFRKRHRDTKAWLERIIESLEQNPEFGKPLSGRLHGIWQLRIGSYRVWYEINAEEKIVILKVILHKNEAERLY